MRLQIVFIVALFIIRCMPVCAQVTHIRYLVVEDWTWKDSAHFPEATQKNAWYADLYFDASASLYVERAEPASEEEQMRWMSEKMQQAQEEGTALINPNEMPFRLHPWEYYFYNACASGKQAWEWVASRSMGGNEACESLQIRWVVHPAEQRVISGVACKKAVGRFRGRQYVAWYAPSIPYAHGPWKLNGLPGLILEAYEENKKLVFRLVGVEYLQQERLEDEVEQVRRQINPSSYYASRHDYLKAQIEEENRKQRMRGAASPFSLQQAAKKWRELDAWKVIWF